MYFSRNKNHLEWNGVDLCQLAKDYHTPLYVMNENLICDHLSSIKQVIEDEFEKSQVLYASKACDFSYMYQLCRIKDWSVDVVSIGEIYTAYKSGFDMSRVYFHGNSKSLDEIRYALQVGVGYVVIDNLEEVTRVDLQAGLSNIKQKVLVRITPGIDPHTFEAVSTGIVDCKFGCAIENGYASEVVKAILNCSHLELVGFHCHVGSQVFEANVFKKSAMVMVKWMAYLKNEFNYITQQLNLGGGFGVRYVKEDPLFDLKQVMHDIHLEIDQLCKSYQLDIPMILFEPGRSIVADAGITLYHVNSVKRVRDDLIYVAVDGGMSDNPRYALYKSKYTVLCVNKMNEKHLLKCTLAGKCCESGDIVACDILLPNSIQEGDTLMVLSTGAYNYTMASNYNRIAKPAVIMLDGKEIKVVVKRESLEDLIRNDYI
ncbi:MAG: diaminopimelate decarboxylase [Traorella sp.]